MEIELRKEDGELVKKFDIPEKQKGVDVVVLGKRAFVRRDCYKVTGSTIYLESQSLYFKE